MHTQAHTDLKCEHCSGIFFVDYMCSSSTSRTDLLSFALHSTLPQTQESSLPEAQHSTVEQGEDMSAVTDETSNVKAEDKAGFVSLILYY